MVIDATERFLKRRQENKQARQEVKPTAATTPVNSRVNVEDVLASIKKYNYNMNSTKNDK